MEMADIYSTLQVDVVDRVATVTLNRPDVRNAFNPTMIREITGAFTLLNARKDLVAVVIRGAGKSFCSGADLNYMKSQADYSHEENLADASQLFEMFWSLRSCPHPLVGRFHGHVMGGGLGLAATCDVSAAVDSTQFCFSEVKLGLVPAVISPFVMERLSAVAARRYMLTGELFSAQDAFVGGLVNKVGGEQEVDQFISELLVNLGKNGPDGMRATKGLMRALSEIDQWQLRREITTKVIAERRASAEGQEGLRSFLEKRAPSWTAAKGQS
jgi:methylglutaconyl-CoA hydratase